MKILKSTVLFLSFFMAFAGCDDTSSSGDSGYDIEAKGTWTGTADGEIVTITISGTKFVWDYAGNDMSADVVTYNENTNIVILKWTKHVESSIVGKFQKMDMTLQNLEGVESLTIDAYDEASSQDAAENVTNIYFSVTLIKS